MEPLKISEGSRYRGELNELVVELTALSAGFRRSLPEGVVLALAQLVRAMNCYYSNLIEGHNTHPVDIERAMRDDYSDEPKTRDLQLEARAHVVTQKWIDDGGLGHNITTREGLCEIHARFCEQLPEDLLWVEEPNSGEQVRVVPGDLRTRDVQVGRHIPISAGAVPRFLDRFDAAYGNNGKAETILSAAAAHHRFLWIHPFVDGNGRVARLMSNAMLKQALDTGGIWSISRGLARREAEYKRHLMACDQPRQGDLDGRGNLSERSLVEFTRFFLQVCIDEVTFMEKLVQPSKLRERIRLWVEEEVRTNGLPVKAGLILDAILYRGDLARGEVAEIVGTGERQARRVVSELERRGVINSVSSRAPLKIAFPAALAGRWMPGLFPEVI